MNLFDDIGELPMLEMRMLGKLNATDLGVVRFDQPTGWERHGCEEMIIILDGAVDLVMEDGASAPHTLRRGDVCVVPTGGWHRQVPRPEVTLMFATDGETTEHKPFEQ